MIREYERTTTAILNGYVHPRVAGYLTALEAALDLARRAGRADADQVERRHHERRRRASAPASTCCSRARRRESLAQPGWREQAGVGNVLTLDIGGTSADLALIIDGRAAIRHRRGRSVTSRSILPSVSVTSIGSGGGSIAWVG